MELNAFLCAIEQADSYTIDEIIDALQRRYLHLYPEEEIVFLSLPRNNLQERKRILELILKAEEKQEIATSLRSSQ